MKLAADWDPYPKTQTFRLEPGKIWILSDLNKRGLKVQPPLNTWLPELV